MKKPIKENVVLYKRIMQCPLIFEVYLRWMNLSRAIAMSEGVVINIGRFIWDSSNCRDYMPLISHQLNLLIPHCHNLYSAPKTAITYFLVSSIKIFVLGPKDRSYFLSYLVVFELEYIEVCQSNIYTSHFLLSCIKMFVLRLGSQFYFLSYLIDLK